MGESGVMGKVMILDEGPGTLWTLSPSIPVSTSPTHYIPDSKAPKRIKYILQSSRIGIYMVQGGNDE